jgi:hypothetical protein
MSGSYRHFAWIALLAWPWAWPGIAAEFIDTAVCEDRAGGQTFFIEQTGRAGQVTALKVAKVDHAGKGINRLLVFTAVPGGIDAGDSYATSDLVLSFASDADAYRLIAKANITLATEGEDGPIIEGFRLHHDNGNILLIIDDAAPLPCRGEVAER